MKPLVVLTLLSTCLGSLHGACPQTPRPAGVSPFPWRMPEYSFHESMAAAINAARGKQRIIVYTVLTLGARDRVNWLMQQRALWTHPLTRKVLGGLPIVAVQKESTTGRTLQIPAFGISIVTPDGRKLLRTIDFARIKVDSVPLVLAEMLRPELRQPEQPGPEAAGEQQIFRSKRAKILNLLDNGDPDAAKKIVAKELIRSPNGFGPRLLEYTFRQQNFGRTYHAGLRGRARPVLDALCIVDDDAGFLRALEGWKAGPIYPILFRDNHYLPLFLEAFAPNKVFLVPRRAGAPVPLTSARLFKAYAIASGGAPDISTPTAANRLWRRNQRRNPGIVLTHPGSRMWAAGLALAAGRHQVLAMEPPVAHPDKRVTQVEMLALRGRLRSHLLDQHIDGMRLHDELDFVTLATELPFRYSDRLCADRTTYAIDDAIARNRFDLPFAYVGRLLGDRRQSLYMAMCGLFLTQKKTLLFSRYGKTGSFGYYGSARAAPLLKDKGNLTHVEHPAATLARWQDMFAAHRNEHGLVHVNSSGGSRNWSTSAGNGSYDDLPLTVPAIVSYVHSNSLGNGYDADTVGGRWLHNGAYSFFGSTSEPYLDAFASIFDVYDRAISRSWPIGAAHRLLPMQQRWRPWKLMFFGDPLIRLRFEEPPRRPLNEGTIPGPLTELGASAAGNPFRAEGLALQLFRVECLAWSGRREAVAKALDGLIRSLSAATEKPKPELLKNVADLVAWSIYRPGGLARYHGVAARLASVGVHSPHLSYVTHALSVEQLRRIATAPRESGAAERLVELLTQHLRAPFSKEMYKRIGSLYKPVFGKVDGGKKLRRKLRDELRRRAKSDKALQAFLRAF